MSSEVQIRVKLLVLLGEKYCGPIDFTVYELMEPKSITCLSMNGPLEIPQDMQTTTPRALYSMRKRTQLKLQANYKSQGIRSGDVLILTDKTDDVLVLGVGQMVANMNNISLEEEQMEETRLKSILRGAAVGVPYAGHAIEALLFGQKKSK